MNKPKAFKLLYAEDDDFIREGYTSYFKTIFKDVYVASNGREALSMYEDFKPDILFFDINMPYIDGLTLIEKIREHDKKVKIIILSAHVEEEKLMRAIPLGLEQYLKKPIQKKELEIILHKTIIVLEKDFIENKILKFPDNIFFDIAQGVLINSNNNKKIHLTKNEIILLKILSNGIKVHYSLDDILEEFWHSEHHKDMSQNSIRNIIKRLKPKLPKNCIENHYGIGYKLFIT